MVVIKSIKVSDLKKSPYNPRTISFAEKEGLKYSINKFGLVQPIIYNKQTGNVVGGNQRLDILKEQGVEETEVVEVDLNLNQEKELNIALNSTTIQGRFSDDIFNMVNEIKAFDVEAFDKLRLFDLLKLNIDSEENLEDFDDNQELINKMDLHPYESYDYITVFYKNSLDFLFALNKLGITKVDAMPDSFADSSKAKIGLGRVIDGEKFNREILEKLKSQ